MKYKSGSRRRANEYERDIVKYWKDNQTFKKSIEARDPANSYVFYDGPPFITGAPHYGTLLSSIIKDAVPRYQTMKGHRVERRWGWDCHGLPAENFVEKQLGITDRRQIVSSPDQPAPLDADGNHLPTISLEKYITTARDSMVANSETWEDIVDRVGRWVEFRGAYRTMDRDYMESVWWAFKQLYQAGKIYEGEKVLMYDTKFATPVSKAEVTMDNDAYQTVTDPSAYVKFLLTGESSKKLKVPDDTAVLAWTTTPWTLPANLMLAVNVDMKYVLVKSGDDHLIVAADCLERVFVDEKHQPIDCNVQAEFIGTDLVGLTYIPLETGSTWPQNEIDRIHQIYAADFVSSESGTGIVHCAPAYGEDDFNLGAEHNIKPFHVIDDNGYYMDTIYRGREVWSNNKFIAKDLQSKGAIWKIEYIRHEYPFNPRSKQRIMYRAIPSWFFDIDGSKPLLLEQNENIDWFPQHLKHGRFYKNIEQAPDWNLSRDRFWASAMPVWKGDKGGIIVVGSYDELAELSGRRLDDYHRPWVDDIVIYADKLDADTRAKYSMQDGETFTRINKVLDCWFESGSMPFAQLHYPFENKEKFEANYPADFIVEYIGQVRAWFYYVHAVNTSLASIGAFGKDRANKKAHMNAYRHVITTGVVAGNDGRKMSKSLGNYTDPNVLMDQYSADSLRFLLLSSPLLNGEDFTLIDKDVSDVARKLSMIWNMYDFFTMYAEVDGWEYSGGDVPAVKLAQLDNPLDRWVISRVHELTLHVEKYTDQYDLATALGAVLPFVDDASNWFVRRSRRRFWKSDDDTDKMQAYQTLHYVLVRLATVLAPFTPFLAEELYRQLTGGESVHLLDWPTNNELDDDVLVDMARVRSLINSGLGLRMNRNDEYGQIKIRQPLAFAAYTGERLDDYYEQIMRDELNVKQISWVENLDDYRVSGVVSSDGSPSEWIELDKKLTPELEREGLSREIIRVVQKARKDAELNVDDRIVLHLTTNDKGLQQAIVEWRDTIANEALVSEWLDDVVDGYVVHVKVGGADLAISLAAVGK